MAQNPADQPTAQVISVLDVPSAEPNRLGKMDALVTYRIDPLNSFTIRIPAEGLTPEKIDTAVRADWNQRKQLLNRTVKL